MQCRCVDTFRSTVIPAHAGIQCICPIYLARSLDSRLRGNDGEVIAAPWRESPLGAGRRLFTVDFFGSDANVELRVFGGVVAAVGLHGVLPP
jgi:hypothetical protein